MRRVRRSHPAGIAARVVLVSLVVWMAGCAGLMKKVRTAPPGEPPAQERPDCSGLQEEVDRLAQAQAKREGETRAIEERSATLQLRLLEKDALVKSLKAQVSTQQAEFDEAIAEVVRSKAKVRSLESKAEAASDMAEAEIALKSAQTRHPAGEPQPPALSQAEQLLAMGGQEFKKGNYGGSLYLTSQARAKVRVAEVQGRPRGSLEPIPGEIRFAAPVDLKVIKISNVRNAPGLDAEVLATLQPGTSLTGYSYKGDWVRVETGDRSMGWVFQGLVGGLE